MIDEMSSLAKRRVNEFHQRHGGECYELDGFYYYPDGAYRDTDILGLLAEPPTVRLGERRPDRIEYDLAVNKLNFFKAKLAVAVRDFDATREKLSMFHPADEDAALKELERLKSIVQARQKEFRKAQAVVDNTSVGKARKGHAEWRQAEAVRISNWRSKLNTVRI